MATIHVAREGQAIVWDRSKSRVLYGISRPDKEVVVLQIPEVRVGPVR